MKQTLYILSLTLLLFACSTKPKDEVPTQELQCEEMDQADELPMMRVPLRVGLSGSRLVMLDLVADSCFYHVVEYPSLKYLYSVGPKGQGDNEIILSTPFQINKDKLYVYDGTKGNIFTYDLEDGSLIKRISTSVRSGIDFAYKNDSTFYMEDMSGKSRVIEWNPDGSNSYFTIPESEGEDIARKAYIWRSYMAYNQESGRLALAAQHGCVLELYDMDKHEVVNIIADDKESYPADMNETKGYCDVQWVGNDLYALCSLETSHEKKMNGITDQGGNILRVFSKDGILKKQYKLDTYIYGFTIDQTNNRLIGITPNNDYPICYWKL